MIGGCLCIFVQPMARGGGIAGTEFRSHDLTHTETKAFLNGVNIPSLFQLRTLFIKLISVICAVGGGLAVGQEGPMIHIGAMVTFFASGTPALIFVGRMEYVTNEIFVDT